MIPSALASEGCPVRMSAPTVSVIVTGRLEAGEFVPETVAALAPSDRETMALLAFIDRLGLDAKARALTAPEE